MSDIILNFPKQFEQSGYHFSRLEEKDLKLLRFWLSEPHIVDWWTPPEEELAAIEEDFKADRKNVARYIVSHQGREFAYIQAYDPSGDRFWAENPQGVGTIGLHQFIGDPSMIGFGHGTNFIKGFVAGIKGTEGISKIIVDPAPDNAPAIKCYQQVGFRKEADITTPDGPATLMSMAT